VIKSDAHVELTSLLRFPVSMLNTTINNSDENEASYVQRRSFSKERKSSKHLPLEKLELALAAWFKQVCESNAFKDGIHLKEKALHIATSYLRGDTTLFTNFNFR
jgi:hypothetical protein